MGNAAKGVVSVEVEGEKLDLCLDMNAICEIEDLYAMDIQTFMKLIDQGAKTERLSLKDLRALLWASMLRSDPKATLVSAGNVAQALGSDLVEVIGKLIAESGLFDAPDDGAAAVGNGKKAKPKAKPAA
ncbi:hypothetical protein [Yoonia sp. 208BN28-4]|uniref:hypothetical protein n=1 Tax=Yoonia sp. 208BN28-4 TaxID=3126505 RepID=UPI003094A637